MELLTDHPKLNRMWENAVESIEFRQDSYLSGGIVESDLRINRGRDTYWPWCWPRTYVIIPLLEAGEFGRVKRWLNYWMKLQNDEGGWLHCYDVRDGTAYYQWEETDNVSYILWYAWEYLRYSGDDNWAAQHFLQIDKAVQYVKKLFHQEKGLIYGKEEGAFIVDGEIQDLSVCYGHHVNAVCAKGLLAASEIAVWLQNRAISPSKEGYPVHDPALAEKAREWGELGRILLENCHEKFWMEDEGYYSVGLLADGTPVKGVHDIFFMQMARAYILGIADEYAVRNWSYIKARLEDFEKLPSTVGVSLKLRQKLSPEWYNIQPIIGQYPVIAKNLLFIGKRKEAAYFVDLALRYVRADDNYLMGESVDWRVQPPIPRTPFREGYPDLNKVKPDLFTRHIYDMEGNYLRTERIEKHPMDISEVRGQGKQEFYSREPGNLLHMSFFMEMVTSFLGRSWEPKGFAPLLPVNVHFIKVKDWRFMGGSTDFEFRDDENCDTGSTSLFISGSLPEPITIGMRVGKPEISLIINDRKMQHGEYNMRLRNGMYFAEIDQKIDGSIFIETRW